jgi:hypothetical protein
VLRLAFDSCMIHIGSISIEIPEVSVDFGISLCMGYVRLTNENPFYVCMDLNL